MSQFKLGGVPSHAHGHFYALRQKVGGEHGQLWSDALAALLELVDPIEAKNLLSEGVKFARPTFPLYLMRINDEEKFLSLRNAGVMFDSGWAKVDIGGFVLEEGFQLRPITKEEERAISDIADEHSANK